MSETTTPNVVAEGVWQVETQINVGGGLSLPLRMTVLRSGDGLALVSPIAIDDEVAAGLAELGEVHMLLAPNLMHHTHLAAAAERYPKARLLGPAGLVKKRPDLKFDGELETSQLSEDIDAVLVAGAPKLSEVVFLHRSSRTLVVTDLVFNIAEASGMSWFFLAMVSRALGRVEQSRLLRWLTKDRAAAGRSVETILALPFDCVVPAHGDVIRTDAQAQLRAGLWWMRGEARRPSV